MRKYLDDESGTVTLLFPGLLVVMFLMMVLVFNIMIWNSQRNDMQIMADCMSRAGATAISKTYAVRERTGHGLQDYHVYNELYSGKYRDIQGTAKRAADEDADIIYREFKKYNENHGWEVNELSIEYNPEGEKWLNAVWNPKLFAYETKPNLIGKEQYKKVRLMAAAPVLWAIARLMIDFTQTISYRYVSELLFDLFAVIFFAMFAIAFAKMCAGMLQARIQMRIFAYGMLASFFALLSAVPRYIMLLMGRQDLLFRQSAVFEVTDLVIPIFVMMAVFAIASQKQYKSVEEYAEKGEGEETE